MNPTDLPLLCQNPDFQPEKGSLLKRHDVLAAISSPINLVQEFKNFKSSSDPSRFLYFENGSWVDFASEVFDELRDGFLHGKSTLEVSVGGNSYIFDFLRMVKVDAQTCATNSIAWIDATGKCFFPHFALDESARPKKCVEVSSEERSDSSFNSNSKRGRRILKLIVSRSALMKALMFHLAAPAATFTRTVITAPYRVQGGKMSIR